GRRRSATRQAWHSIAAAGEQQCRFEERQPDHVRVRATHPSDQRRRPALNRVPAGLATPFATAKISPDLRLAEALEGDLAVDAAQCQPMARARQSYAAVDPMAAPRQELEAEARRDRVRGFRQDTAAARDDRVCCQE